VGKSVVSGTSTLGVMSVNRDREEEIFDAARELAAHERAAYLAKRCGEDADLRQRIEGMLAADAAAGDFLKTHNAPSPTVILADASRSPSGFPGQNDPILRRVCPGGGRHRRGTDAAGAGLPSDGALEPDSGPFQGQ
jgi:hypothetical protein